MKSMDFEFLSRGMHKITYDTLFERPDGVLLDVRTYEEMESVIFPLKYHIGKTLRIPLNELPDRLDELPRDRPVAVLCVSDIRSAMAYLYLQVNGYEHVRILAGGLAGLAEQMKPGKIRRHMKSVPDENGQDK